MAPRTPRDSSLLHRRQALLAGAAFGSALLLPSMARTARAATVAFNYDTDRSAGFIPDPNQHRSVGYITELTAFGAPALNKDLSIDFSWSGPAPTYGPFASSRIASGGIGRASVVGVMEKFSWGGTTQRNRARRRRRWSSSRRCSSRSWARTDPRSTPCPGDRDRCRPTSAPNGGPEGCTRKLI